MFIKEVVSTPISFDKKTCVSVNTKFGFTLVPKLLCSDLYQFHFEDIIGKFEIIKIASDSSFSKELPYDKVHKTFTCSKDSVTQIFISANVEMKKVHYVQVSYHLFISPTDMKMLDIYDYYHRIIVLSGYEKPKFNLYIKKIAEGKIEIEIENPFDVRINGISGNHFFHVTDKWAFDSQIQFIFDPSSFKEESHEAEKVESRPESETGNPLQSNYRSASRNLIETLFDLNLIN
uniref:Uncharacterized protein n=1 Tax=Panagrolaimus sp. ES5 TaxID=591445 RepID=A0AC34F780_9BILA